MKLLHKNCVKTSKAPTEKKKIKLNWIYVLASVHLLRAIMVLTQCNGSNVEKHSSRSDEWNQDEGNINIKGDNSGTRKLKAAKYFVWKSNIKNDFVFGKSIALISCMPLSTKIFL